MSKELKIDERILRDQIIRKSAVDNMTNISKQREDLKQGIMPVAPVNKSATDIAEDRTTQAGDAIQNLIDLGFNGQDAQEIANTMSHQDRVAFNRAYPQIKTDFNNRFNIKNTTPAFFIEYIKKYLEVLKASSGVPSNLSYVQDNFVTTPNDLLRLVLSAEAILSLQNELRATYGLPIGSPLDVVLDELGVLLPDTEFYKSLGIFIGVDPVAGYKYMQKILSNTKSLPNPKELDKIIKDRATSNADKLVTLLSKLGTLRASNKTQLNAISTFLKTTYPSTPPPPPPTTALSPDVATFITDVQSSLPVKSGNSGKTIKTVVADKCIPLCLVDGVEFYLCFYKEGGDYYGIIRIINPAPLDGDMIRDKILYADMYAFLTSPAFTSNPAINDGFTAGYQAYIASGAPSRKANAKSLKDYVKNTGVDVILNGKRMAGSGIKKSPRAKTVKKTELKPIKLGKGFENNNDPYTMYDEELKLTPIHPSDVIKKQPKKKLHTVSEGVDGDEYQKFDDKENRYIAFGKYAINMRQLKKSILQIVYKSLAPNPSFPSKKISSELQQYLFELLTNKKSLPTFYKHVPEEDKKMFEKLAIFAGVFDKLNLPRVNSLEDEKKEMDRFKLLHGEFVAGNDNVSIARELRNLILKFLAENRISKAKAYEYLLELNNA
jgi:Holliday junction resolvasome RuvABC DNA-binding subunit